MRITRCTLVLALLGTAANGADVYRSTAADGTVSFSDRPQGENSVYVFVPTPHGAPPATTRTADAPSDPNAAPQAPAPPTPPSAEGPTAAQLRAERQKNCETARETQQRYELSRRLFRTNSAGEREYLDDQQVAEARAKAAANVKDWCG